MAGFAREKFTLLVLSWLIIRKCSNSLSSCQGPVPHTANTVSSCFFPWYKFLVFKLALTFVLDDDNNPISAETLFWLQTLLWLFLPHFSRNPTHSLSPGMEHASHWHSKSPLSALTRNRIEPSESRLNFPTLSEKVFILGPEFYWLAKRKYCHFVMSKNVKEK